MSRVKKDSPKRDHSRAKQAGVTHIGCPRSSLQSLSRVLREINRSTGRKIRPFDLLRDYPEIFAIYEQIAQFVGENYGFNIDVNISVSGKRGARNIRILKNGANARDPQLILGLADDSAAGGPFNPPKTNDQSREASKNG